MKKLPVYLLFLTLYPVLALWVQNIQVVDFTQIVRVLIMSILLGVLFFLVTWLLVRKVEKAGLIVAAAILVFFFYGHLYEGIREWSFEFARHRYLLPLLIGLFSAWVLYVLKIKQTNELTWFINVFTLFLFLMPLYTIGNFQFKSYILNRDKQAPTVINQDVTGDRPDIYYIILDGYGREDILEKFYHFDNSEFIGFLKEKGFYVAQESTSNYARTLLSLTSSLNMAYVQDLFPDLNPKSKDYAQHFELIRHSAVRNLLAENGYRLVTVDNDFKTAIPDAEIFMTPDPATLSERVDLENPGYSIDLNTFEGLFVRSSLAKLWVDLQIKQGKSNLLNIVAVEAPYNAQRRNILFGINSIADIADMDGDNFVFIHIVAPHPPFVFGPNGEQIQHDYLFSFADDPYSQGPKGTYAPGYTGQVAYINKRLMSVIDYLFEHSKSEPIIILQGDHGPKGFDYENITIGDYSENFSNLNAYYFPGQNYESLYQSISPVNSFRVVFNEFFGMNFPILKNENYYSDGKYPFKFKVVTEQVQKKDP